MEFDQQKLQKLKQHNLICTAIIFFSYMTLFLFKITFPFFFHFKATKNIYISIDDRNVSIQWAMRISIKKEELTFTLK